MPAKPTISPSTSATHCLKRLTAGDELLPEVLHHARIELREHLRGQRLGVELTPAGGVERAKSRQRRPVSASSNAVAAHGETLSEPTIRPTSASGSQPAYLTRRKLSTLPDGAGRRCCARPGRRVIARATARRCPRDARPGCATAARPTAACLHRAAAAGVAAGDSTTSARGDRRLTARDDPSGRCAPAGRRGWRACAGRWRPASGRCRPCFRRARSGAGRGFTYAATSPTRAVTAADVAVTRCGRDRDRGLAQQRRGVLALGGQHDRDDLALLAGAGGAARAVQVRLVLGRRVDVDDELDVVDVHTAGGDIGRDEHRGLAGGEGGEVAVACDLREVAVQVDARGCPHR